MTVEAARKPKALPLRGRSAELDRVSLALQRVRDTGQGALVIILGEAGIGKTAVLNAVADRAQSAGFATGIGSAHERDLQH